MTDSPYYRIEIAGLPLININRTKGGRWVSSPKKAALRKAAKAAASEATIPRMDRARVICHVTREVLGTKAKWDPANWYPSAKACVDGFTDAGLWPDDSVHYVLGPDMRGVTTVKDPPYGNLVFHIYDLSEVSHVEPEAWATDL